MSREEEGARSGRRRPVCVDQGASPAEVVTNLCRPGGFPGRGHLSQGSPVSYTHWGGRPEVMSFLHRLVSVSPTQFYWQSV